MGVEAREGSLVGPLNKVSVPFGPLRFNVGEDAFVSRMLELEDRIYQAIQVAFAHGARDEIVKTAQEGYFPIVYANHTSHYDGRPLAKTTKQIIDLINQVLPEERRFKGFVLPVATSIDSGDQSSALQKYFHDNVGVKLAQDMLFTTDYTREKDQKTYGLPSNMLSFARTMKQYIRSRHGIAVFPEATVEGGRSKKGWIGVNGMQEFEEKTIKTMAKLIIGEGLTPVFIPIGIYGSNRIFSPNTLQPPNSTIIRALLPGLPRGLVKTQVGIPIGWDDMITWLKVNNQEIDEHSINNALASKLATLLPGSAKGVFRKAA